jgi:hypothetical protein
MLQDKVLVVSVTRNNPVMLKHMFESFERHSPGYPCDFLIIDHESDSKEQLKVLEQLSTKYKVITEKNNRVEVSFDIGWKKNQDYKYYFFTHDDTAANKDNWLKSFVDRMESGYVEEIVKHTHLSSYKIGRVGAISHFWRSYTSILGYSVQCLFLKDILEEYMGAAPEIFKYCDCDRVLVSNECLKASNGIRNLQEFKDLKESNKPTYDKLCEILNRHLQYPDGGIPPMTLYPAGECWNKFCLTAEFFNSVIPLSKGWRTVGLEDDGYLEAIHGHDVPVGHNFIHHYGAPNFKEFIAKKLNTDAKEVTKNLNNKVFLMKCDVLVKKYFKEREVDEGR